MIFEVKLYDKYLNWKTKSKIGFDNVPQKHIAKLNKK